MKLIESQNTIEKLILSIQQIQIQQFPASDLPEITFEEWATCWLGVYKKGVVKDNTFNSTYREPVELHLIPYFGSLQLALITPIAVQIYFKSLSNSFSLETQRKIRNAMRLIYDAAIECGICRTNPVGKTLRITSTVKPIEKHTWSQTEYDIAYQFALTHPCGLDIITLMETGISRSELLGLRWDNHDEKHRILHIRHGLVSQKSTQTGRVELVCDGLKNRHRQRYIPLSPALSRLITLKRMGEATHKLKTEYIFHNPTGGPYDPNNWYRRVLKRFMADLHNVHPEVQFLTTHELRHTRATLLKDRGVDIFTIARLLGHCNLNMLAQRYAHDNVEALRAALEK